MKEILFLAFHVCFIVLALVTAIWGDSLTSELVGFFNIHPFIGEYGVYGAKGVSVVEGYAYVAGMNSDRSGVWVLDISDPANPHEVGFCAARGIWEIKVVGRYAFLAVGRDGLRIMDLSTPTNPKEIGLCDATDIALGVHVMGNHAYLADNGGGLRVIDISNPSMPREIGHYDAFGEAKGVYAGDSYAYVTAGSDGLRIIDISEPSKPYEVGACDTPGFAFGVYKVSEHCYIADGNGGLRVVDVSNPVHPHEVGFCHILGSASRTHVVNQYAYVAASGGGLSVIDISDPMRPLRAGSHETYGDALAVHMSDGYVYLTDEYLGLWILKFVPGSESESHYISATPGEYVGKTEQGDHVAFVVSEDGLEIISAESTVGHGITSVSNSYGNLTHIVDNKFIISVKDHKLRGKFVSSGTVVGSWNGFFEGDYEIVLGRAVYEIKYGAGGWSAFPEDSIFIGLAGLDRKTLANLLGSRVLDIPDQTINEGEVFAAIKLDDYLTDPDNAAADIVWTYSGNKRLMVSISDDRIANVSVPEEWTGSESIIFAAMDPIGPGWEAEFSEIVDLARELGMDASLSNQDRVTFTVTPARTIYSITATSKGHGSISPSREIRVEHGASQEFVIAPDEGYSLKDVIVDDSSALADVVDGRYRFGNITDNHTIEASFGLKGDVNEDDLIRANDAILTLRIAAGMMIPDEYQKWAADMNDDGGVKSNDAILILRKAIGLAAPGMDALMGTGGTATLMLVETHGVAGESVTVPLKVDNIGGLTGGDICIAYDSSVLRAIDVSSNAGILLANNLGEAGMVRIAFAGTGSLSNGILAEIQFNILTDNASPLEFKNVELYRPDALPMDSRKMDGRFISWAMPPENSALSQNYPNPFNPETWIPYELAEPASVVVDIYDAKGQLVRRLVLGHCPAGLYTSRTRAAYWDGRNEAGEYVASGAYFYTIQAGGFTATKKMVIAK